MRRLISICCISIYFTLNIYYIIQRFCLRMTIFTVTPTIHHHHLSLDRRRLESEDKVIGANEEGGWWQQMKRWNGGHNKQWQHWLVEAALLAIESADVPKSKIPKKTHQCRSHPHGYQSVAMVSIGRGVNVEDSRQNLEMSVQCKKSRQLILDVVSRCNRCGVIETESFAD